jgi:hypothetical protein
MVDPKKCADILYKHFAEITTEQFVENMKKYCPEIFEDDVTAPSSSNTDESEEKAATA